MNPSPPRNNRSRRVTFIATDLSSGGGVNKVIRDLAVLFRRRLSAEVTVVNARSDRPSAYPFPAEIPVEARRRQSLAAYFAQLWRLRRSKADVVVSSWTQDNILVAVALLGSRFRVILVEHSSWHHQPRHIRLLRRLVYPVASAVVVLNPRDLEHYRRWLPRVRHIPNPIVAPMIADNPREKLIIAVGHLEPSKQFDQAVQAMAHSGLEGDGWSLTIVGSGREQVRLERLIAELELTRTRIVPPGDIGGWYARATLLLVTSRRESFSLVVAEAMLSGVVPLAYASDGPSFLLQEFPEQLIPIDDVERLATRMREIMTTNLDPLRRELRTEVESRFDPEIIADQWAALICTD